MKKISTLVLSVLVATVSLKAQIVNPGFETWTTTGNYQEPNGWATMNPYCTGPFYSATKSTDHYPASVGSYSLRIEDNTSLTQYTGGFGMVISDTMAYPFQPSFPVMGHPTSLTGWFKYLPLNGDSMWIQVMLFYQGNIVSYQHMNAVSTPSWTSFNITLSNYTTADSATILLAAYYPSNPSAAPHGNSVLYVDNLNFDVLINSVETQTAAKTDFNLYPNPATDFVNLNLTNAGHGESTVSIYDFTGKLISAEKLLKNQTQLNTSDLINGIYMVEVKSAEGSSVQKLVIQP